MGVHQQPALVHRSDVRRGLPVPELADVEVACHPVQPRNPVPAEHDVARRLHQALALDDPLAAVRELAASEERLEHRALCLLQLQEQRVLVIPAEQQRDPGARADAADADDLAGEVDEAVTLEQPAAVASERAAIGADGIVQLDLDVETDVLSENSPGSGL